MLLVFVALPLCSALGRNKALDLLLELLFGSCGENMPKRPGTQPLGIPQPPQCLCFLGSNKCAVSSPGLCTSLAVWFSHENISKPFVNFPAFGAQFLQRLAGVEELFHFGVSISKMPINLSLALQYYVWVKMTFYYSSNVTVFPVGLIIPISTQNSYWCHPQIKFPLKIILNPESCYVFLFSHHSIFRPECNWMSVSSNLASVYHFIALKSMGYNTQICLFCFICGWG